MKKNILLYILLTFLIVMNGFFLFQYLDKPTRKGQKPQDFIAKRLKFDEKQLEQFDQLNRIHHKDRRMFSDDMKQLKDALFSKISEENVSNVTIDSLINLIGKKAQAREMMVFNHFRKLRAICNEKQKVLLDKIIKDGLHKGRRGKGTQERKENRPHPPPRN